MSMVGLFWITDAAAHIGAPPNSPGPGVLLTEEGLTGLGEDQGGRWAWQDIRRVSVAGAPVRSSVARTAGILLDTVITSAFGGGDDGPAMFVRLETPEEEVELTVIATAASYSPAEHRLSQDLLDAYATGRATPAALLAWGRTHGGGTPGRAEREELLAGWGGRAARR
ncbi:hypothetical protein OG520_21580 [Streptomyces sp. NBC_00984]|uniref:hypothetical protein n=1 Tax=Streptomyces sp. NBC_00984 TaxID=2903700 RepID=UPI003863D7C4|nr:hypothetical protein OG520_21580 [Streptomyces sp. NBC_00984]